MQIKAEIKDLEIRIARLDKLAADRREILNKKFKGEERLYGVHNAYLTPGDKQKIEDDLVGIETQAEGLRAKLADLKDKLAMQTDAPENKNLRKELEALPGEALKQFDKLTKALHAADEAAREFEKIKRREAKLKLQLEGMQTNWRAGRQGQAISLVLGKLGQLFKDLKFNGTYSPKKGYFNK